MGQGTIPIQNVNRETVGGNTEEIKKPAGDISDAQTQLLERDHKFTLYLQSDAAINITVKLTPNGEDYFEIDESANGDFDFAGAGDKVARLDYDATGIQVEGDNDTANVLVILRETA